MVYGKLIMGQYVHPGFISRNSWPKWGEINSTAKMLDKQCSIHNLLAMSWGKVSLGVNVHHVKSGGHPSTSVALSSELLSGVTKALGGPPNPRPESERETSIEPQDWTLKHVRWRRALY